MKNAQSFTDVKEKQNFYHTINECRSTGIFILNKDLSVVYANSKGIELCHKIKKDFIFNCKNPTFSLPSLLNNVVSELELKPGNRQIIENILTDRYLINCHIFDNKSDKFQKNRFLLSIEEISAVNEIDEDKLKTKYAISAREIEIINCIYKGLKNSEVADTLFICEGTVKVHLQKIFYKMGVKNRISLIRKATSGSP